jgi:hypothetical protein
MVHLILDLIAAVTRRLVRWCYGAIGAVQPKIDPGELLAG